MRGRTWTWAVLAGAILVALAVALTRARSPGPEDGAAQESTAAQPPEDVTSLGAPGRVAAARPMMAPVKEGPLPDAGDESLAEAQARLERAQESLTRYREASRYPPTSRPLSEEPDRMHLHDPAERTRPLDKDSSTLLTLGQDRTFVTATETARLWVRCATQTGARVSCEVANAQVSVVNEDDQPPVDRHAPIAFRDDGQGGDEAADDGTWTALLQPSALGLGDVNGTLKVDLEVTDSRDVAHPFFTLVTTGGAPAQFTRAVKESLVDGSLALAVGISVQEPGQYVVHGRVDDARGRPLAYLEFNEPLEKGEHEVGLLVFGKLIHDLNPTFPLTLRDVDGFLLREEGYPDRKVMTAMEGPVYRTQLYRVDQFSDAEWTSEQRDRYLQELQNDVDRAQDAVDRAHP